MIRRYSSAPDFKQALEDRLRHDASGPEIQRRRQLVVFERMLARLASAFGSVVLKGGLCLEIRIDGARTTRDIDLAILGEAATILAKLQALGQLDLGDFMSFEIQPDRSNPELTGDGLLYGGKRFRVECKLAGKIYGARFGLDVVFGAHMLGDATRVQGKNYLDFAGIAAPALLLIPVETHVAEKLHAYTLPRPVTQFARSRSARYRAPGYRSRSARRPAYRRGDPAYVSSASNPRCTRVAPTAARRMANALRRSR